MSDLRKKLCEKGFHQLETPPDSTFHGSAHLKSELEQHQLQARWCPACKSRILIDQNGNLHYAPTKYGMYGATKYNLYGVSNIPELIYVSVKTPPSIHRHLAVNKFLHNRLTITYGNLETGEPFDTIPGSGICSGYVRNTTGPLKSFIMVYNRCSCTGDLILTENILQIRHSNKKYGGIIYEHPNFKGHQWTSTT